MLVMKSNVNVMASFNPQDRFRSAPFVSRAEQMSHSDRSDMTHDGLTLTAKTRRGKKNKQLREGRVCVGPVKSETQIWRLANRQL
jgi:hypothetical protein